MGEKLYVAGENGNLYAIDLNKRQLQWVYPTAGAISSTPAVADGLVYMLSMDGTFYALSTSDGRLAWSFSTLREQRFSARNYMGIDSTEDPIRDPWDFWLSSPLVAGSILWRYAMPSRSWVVPTPSIDDERIYLGSSIPGLVLAVDKHSGEEVWRHDTKVWSYSSPLVLGNYLLSATMKGELLALDAASGELVWQYH